MKKRSIIVLVSVIVLTAAAAALSKAAYVVPVLMYHSIDYSEKTTKLSVSPENFERQMEFLRKSKYNVVGLDKLIPYIKKKEKIPPKTVAITFDDGYYNNYRYAFPVLKKYNLPATIFVIVNKIGKEGWVDWGQLKEMADSGIILIGSHTKSHLWLPSLGQKRLEEELAGSKKILEDRLRLKANLLSYPIGAFDERVKEAAKAAGYILAVTTNPGRFRPADDVYAVKRIKISRTSDNLFVFWFETSGYYTWIKEHRDD